MLVPVIKNIQSALSPFEVYQNVYAASEVSFFLDSAEHRPPDQKYSYIGSRPFLELTVNTHEVKLTGAVQKTYPVRDFMKVVRSCLKKYQTRSAHSFFTGGAVGFWSYEAAGLFEQTVPVKKNAQGIPLIHLGFYQDVIAYDHASKKYSLVILVDSKKKRDIPARFEALGKFFTHSPKKEKAFSLKSFRAETSKLEFMKKVGRVKEYIRAGDIYQANLSQKFLFRYGGSPLRVYQSLRTINPSPFASFVKIRDLHLVSSSPERLIMKRGRFCETRPIAGTRPLTRKPHAVVRRGLLTSRKERAEHIMLVDLERNDLGRVCDFRSVCVEEMMVTEKYSHVMHIVSKITGRLRPERDGLDLLAAVFPGGTITGCPKIRCMQIIEELEPSARGPYTGSLGYLDFRGDLDFNIIIRTLVMRKNRGSLQVGAGIVYDSDERREYEETLHKGKALRLALERASAGKKS